MNIEMSRNPLRGGVLYIYSNTGAILVFFQCDIITSTLVSRVPDILTIVTFIAAYTNNEINSEKNYETYTCFSAVVGGQHIAKLTTSPFAPQILF